MQHDFKDIPFEDYLTTFSPNAAHYLAPFHISDTFKLLGFSLSNFDLPVNNQEILPQADHLLCSSTTIDNNTTQKTNEIQLLIIDEII